jgi:hypothetical protein
MLRESANQALAVSARSGSVPAIERLCIAMILVASISGCDDSNYQNAGPNNSGTPLPNDLAQGAQIGNAVSGLPPGCQPAGGWGCLGNPGYTYSTDAHIDTDGGSMYNDATGQGNTSSGFNSDNYPGVVLTRTMADDGIQMGDLCLVTNNTTGQTMLAKVYDTNFDSSHSAYRDQCEVSDYLASQLGIQMLSNGNTVGTNPITIQAYGGTSDVSLDCDQSSDATVTSAD